jgi:hypothetical protein
MGHTRPREVLWLVLAGGLLLTGCQGKTAALADLFPGSETLPDWTASGASEVFDRENIYDLVDGQADSYFAYGFEQVAVQSYENAAGARLRITIWQVATPPDAYGLFTSIRSGTPVPVGNDGDADPGRRIVFWQDRYLADLFVQPAMPEGDLQELAQLVSVQIPAGGARPTLLESLPSQGLVASSAIFFHEEISIQDWLWLGGENILGLGPETDCMLARYDLDGKAAQLVLVQYPTAQAAPDALATLQGTSLNNLVVADVHGRLLGAVFGEADAAPAGELLSEALGAESQ